MRPSIKVCTGKHCACRGSEKIVSQLAIEIGNEAEVIATRECFRLCNYGPNVAVDGNVLKGMEGGSATRRVRAEIAHPAVKRDGVGTKSLDSLDAVLDDLIGI